MIKLPCGMPKKVGENKNLANSLCTLMEFFGWSWKEVSEIPIPALFLYFDYIKEQNKQIRKSMKGGRRGN